MFKKKHTFLVLLSLLIFIVAISAVSAADDVTTEDLSVNEAPVDMVSVEEAPVGEADTSLSDNALKSENEDVIEIESIEEDSKETVASDVNEEAEAPENTLASIEDDVISEENNKEVLGSSPSASSYNVRVYDVTIKEDEDICIPIYISPSYNSNDLAYDFNLTILNSSGSNIYSKNLYSSSVTTYLLHTVDKYLDVGTYTLRINNWEDGVLMSNATLQIISEDTELDSPSYDSYSVGINDISLEEGVEKVIPIQITPNSFTYYAYDFWLGLYDSAGNEIIKEDIYDTEADTYYPYQILEDLNPGIYEIRLINYLDGRLMDNATLIFGDYMPHSSAKVDDLSIELDKEIIIPIHINPNSQTTYAYDFYFRIYDSAGDQIYSENLYSHNMITLLNYTVDDYLDVGTYTIKLINYTGGALLDTAILTIFDHPSQYATFTISQSGSYYNSKYVTVKVVNRDTKAPIKNTAVTLKFSNGKSATVTTNSNGVASYKVPFDAGTYNVKAVSANKYVKGQSADLTVKILKHTGTITMKQVGKYYKDKKITVKLYDSTTKSVVKSQIVKIKFSNGKTVNVKTNSKGIATYKVNFKPGKYTATASVSNKNIAFASKKLSKIKIIKVPIKIVAKKFKTSYDSGKYYKIKVINRVTKKGVKGVKLKIKIKGGKTLTRTTKAGGKITFDASKYKVGKHKVSIKVASKKYHTGKAKKSSILIKKGKASIYAPETINCLKRNENYTIYVYNNYSYRPVKNAKVTIKVYTGKKAKTYTRKTDADGAARFNTKSLKKGKHKVVVSLKANKKYKKAKAKGLVEISKKIPTNIGYYYPLHYRGFSTTIYYGGYYGYTTTYVTAVGVDVYLRDKSGHDLYGKTVKVTHSNGNSETGNSGDRIFVSGSNSGSITLSFAGDSKYLPSTYTFYL